MTSEQKAVLYEVDFGFTQPGQIYYPPALGSITPILAELNGEEIRHPKSFEGNISLYLDLIFGRFRSFHDTHRAAQQVIEAYRTQNRQYCLYLRSFSLGGVVINTGFKEDRLVQQKGFIAHDRQFRKLIKSFLPADFNSVSFINTFDLYPSGNEEDKVYMEQVTIPSFRVLSHNWREIVGHVVRGAKLIVMNVDGATEGVAYELDLIRDNGLAGRTVVTGSPQQEIPAINDFFAFVPFINKAVDHNGPEGERLAQAITRLSHDDYTQTTPVPDLSDFPCRVIDRQIDAATKFFDADTLANVPYDLYIPSSLAGNWGVLVEAFPEMTGRWQAIQAKMSRHETLSANELAGALYSALRVTYVAVTLERYYELAFGLSTMGMAHRTLTGKSDVMVTCYRHAEQCARWHGDQKLAAFFAQANSSLAQESL